MSSESTRDVVLVGGGHSHIQVLDHFRRNRLPNARLTLVVDRRIAMYSGMVPGFVAGQYGVADLEIDAVGLAEKAGARVVLSPALRVDTERQQIVVADGPPVAYDVAAFDIGSTVGGLELPGVKDHAVPTRPITDFVHRVDALLGDLPAGGSDPFRVVVVGGGAGGMELIFTLEHRIRSAGLDVEALLIEGGSRIVYNYPDQVRRRVERAAERRGIAVRCDTFVEAAEEGGVLLSGGERLSCDLLVWVAGPAGHPVFEPSGIATDKLGFALVRPTLQFKDHDNLMGTGDCVTFIDFPATPKAGVYAVRQGPVIIRNLLAWLQGRPLASYTPQKEFLTLMNVGDGSAIGAKWGISFEGRWVMRLKDRIDRAFMGRFH
ncbi:MAG: FAD-dependent oxidoreductase [Gemmatimonadota bacterium]|nr:MAG: FAD-dependent oxidoreductase [Gemmatimonadota bacterium]